MTKAATIARGAMPRSMLLRLVAAAIGGYALCWALFVALCVWLPFEKATVWYFTGQIAPLPFLGALLWAFIARTPLRALTWPFGLAAICAVMALAGGAWR